MPRTNEIVFNVRLLDVLETKHPRWREHSAVEQQGVLHETARRPDLVIRPPGGIPVVLELSLCQREALKKTPGPG